MLTLRDPIQLHIAQSLTGNAEAFGARIMGNYSLLGAHYTPKDLLFLLTAPPEPEHERGRPGRRSPPRSGGIPAEENPMVRRPRKPSTPPFGPIFGTEVPEMQVNCNSFITYHARCRFSSPRGEFPA